MQTIIDILGSIFMGSAIILIITNFNLQMMNTTKEQIQNNGSLYKAIGLNSMIEYDLYKVGFRDSTSDKIIAADSTTLTFRSDIDNNSTIDSVRYTLSSQPEIRLSDEYAVYRQINSSQTQVVGHATTFRFIYYDSLGVKIPYASLTSSANRRLIKTIEATMVTRSDAGSGNTTSDYQSTVLNKKVRPKNL